MPITSMAMARVENFSAFIETGLLLLTCVWIVYEAIKRLFFHSVEIEPSMAAFLVMFLSMAIDAWRSRALGRIADEVRQPGAGSRRAAFFDRHLVERRRDRGPRAGLDWAQLSCGVAAPGRSDCGAVCGGRGGVRELASGAENDGCAAGCGAGRRAQPDPRTGSATVDGVLEVERVRFRKAGNRYFADVSVGLERNFTFQRSEQVSDAVTSRVREVLPDADVMVHSVPRARRTENIFDRIRAVATRHNFNVHDVSVQDLNGQLHVEQHLELDEQLSMKQAHDEVTRLETEMRSEVPEICDHPDAHRKRAGDD